MEIPKQRQGYYSVSYDDSGTYCSLVASVGVLSRLLPSAAFYARAMKVVFSADFVARAGKYNYFRWSKDSYDILLALESVGVQVEITGAHNISAVQGPCVFIANHMSTLETFLLPSIVVAYRDVTFVVKEALVRLPIFGSVIRAVEPITVGRKNPREDLKAVLDGGSAILATGKSIIIFPQGGERTRSTVFDTELFNSIGVKLAKKAGVPVVPLALKTDAWGANKKILKDMGKIDPALKVYFCFGEPMVIEGRGNEQHEAITAFIVQKLKAWGGQVRIPAAASPASE